MTPAATGPFEHHATRRYDYAWHRLRERSGRHLDIGSNTGEFLGALSRTTALECHGVDAHAGYVAEAQARYPALPFRHVPPNEPALPYPDAFFSSVTLLDTLEHVSDESACLAEVRRVLAPDGIAIVTVPRQHILSLLDPDNAKYRWPRLHRFVYSRRFGADVYHQRFVDLSDGMRGDIAAARQEHRNYADATLTAILSDAGFRVLDLSGANLFWRLFHVPALLTRSARLRRLCERAIWLDGRLFSSANLFVTATPTTRAPDDARHRVPPAGGPSG